MPTPTTIHVIIPEVGDPRYPDGQQIRHGDTVVFQVDGTIGEVVVTFETPCCFTSSDQLDLNANSLTTSSQQKTVASLSPPKWYHFDADIPPLYRKKFPNWEVKRGDLEVVVDPPEEKEKKEKKDKHR